MAKEVTKERYIYFAVIQNSEKATFSRKFVYINKCEWTDPNGLHVKAICKSIEPINGFYVIDLQGEYKKEKLAILNKKVKSGLFPIIGPFDTVEKAIIAERKARPLTDKEKIAHADSVLSENVALREKVAEFESGKEQKESPKGEINFDKE